MDKINIENLDKSIMSCLSYKEIGMCFSLMFETDEEKYSNLCEEYEKLDADSFRVAVIVMHFIEKYCVRE